MQHDKENHDFLDIEEMTRTTFEIIKEASDMLMELQSFLLRQANKFLGNIPLEADEGGNEEKMAVTLFVVPRNT